MSAEAHWAGGELNVITAGTTIFARRVGLQAANSKVLRAIKKFRVIPSDVWRSPVATGFRFCDISPIGARQNVSLTSPIIFPQYLLVHTHGIFRAFEDNFATSRRLAPKHISHRNGSQPLPLLGIYHPPPSARLHTDHYPQQVNAILILNPTDGSRVLAKYYRPPHSDASTPNPYPTVKEQTAFEKGLVDKTAKTSNDIILYDGRIVVFKAEGDVVLYVVGGMDENELLLWHTLLGFRDSLNVLLKYPPLPSLSSLPSSDIRIYTRC